MKAKILLIFWLFVFNSFAFAQIEKTGKFDEFGRIPCGDFLARMHGLFVELTNSPDTKLYIVYYGARYRRKLIWSRTAKDHAAIKLEYAHRDDGLSWAKSIPLYLTSETGFPSEMRNSLKNRFVLVNGGFRENTELELWIVSKGDAEPKPTPTTSEKNIKFRKDKPYPTPNLTTCYDGL